jgi:ABC-type proline/glycine betaine transport system permease subunit
MSPQLAEAFARLPAYLGGHVAVSVTALLIGLAISLPLALLAMRRPALRNVLLGAASVVQTIPSLALLALFYPLLLGLSALGERLFGSSFSALGFLPSVLALTLYSMLPVLRNTITGLNGVDPAINEAALGVGMTRRQSLVMVELPLALPVIMAGLRIATVSTVALTTIGALVAYGGLGNLLYNGVTTDFRAQVLAASIICVAIAVVLDGLLLLLQKGLTPWTRGGSRRPA